MPYFKSVVFFSFPHFHVCKPVYMVACVWAHMCGNAFACSWVCTWRLEVDVSILLADPSTVFTESRISQSNPELAAVVSLSSLLDLGGPLSPVPKAVESPCP